MVRRLNGGLSLWFLGSGLRQKESDEIASLPINLIRCSGRSPAFPILRMSKAITIMS